MPFILAKISPPEAVPTDPTGATAGVIKTVARSDEVDDERFFDVLRNP